MPGCIPRGLPLAGCGESRSWAPRRGREVSRCDPRGPARTSRDKGARTGRRLKGTKRKSESGRTAAPIRRLLQLLVDLGELAFLDGLELVQEEVELLLRDALAAVASARTQLREQHLELGVARDQLLDDREHFRVTTSLEQRADGVEYRDGTVSLRCLALARLRIRRRHARMTLRRAIAKSRSRKRQSTATSFSTAAPGRRREVAARHRVVPSLAPARHHGSARGT